MTKSPLKSKRPRWFPTTSQRPKEWMLEERICPGCYNGLQEAVENTRSFVRTCLYCKTCGFRIYPQEFLQEG
jgi:hypothetical protein